MKFATISKSLMLSLALLMASGAFAAEKASLTLTHPATVNGTTLKAGDYKLQWDGSGPNVEVSIVQGKKVVATVPAKIVELGSTTQNNAAVMRVNSDGTSTLAGARFEGKKYGLELGSESSDGMQPGSSK
jgi:ABC-type nitrate/sulfonate/bicarbonate transport system substrate-binding protein